MPENEITETGQGTETTESQSGGTSEPVIEAPPEIDNATLKKHPWVQEMATKLSELQREKTEREQADAKAKKDAEMAALEKEGKYKEALQMKEQENARLQEQHKKEILERDLKNGLYREKFTHDVFIDGAIARYNPELHGTADEYVKSLVSDEANAMFRTDSGGTPPPPPPGSVSVTGRKLTPDQIKQMENSPDRKVRLQAIEYKRQQYDNG